MSLNIIRAITTHLQCPERWAHAVQDRVKTNGLSGDFNTDVDRAHAELKAEFDALPLYRREFSDAFHEIPAEVLALVAAGEAEDRSWHNDVSPSFGTTLADGRDLVIWIDSADPSESEWPEREHRFSVAFYGGDDNEQTLSTNDIHEAIAHYRKQKEATR